MDKWLAVKVLDTDSVYLMEVGSDAAGPDVFCKAADAEALRKDAELLAWVLTHPETAAECLEDAAGGEGTARENLERRITGLAAAMVSAPVLGDA